MKNVQLMSLKQEHYTPSGLLEKARSFFDGQIDLDVASNLVANRLVKANRFMSVELDALSQKWTASSLWCNPPGGKLRNKSLAALFWDKFQSEYKAGNFQQGMFLGFSLELIPKRLEILRYHTLIFGVAPYKQKPDYLTGSGRIKFLDRDLIEQNTPTHGSFLTYTGPNYLKFMDTFKDDGTTVRVDTSVYLS